MTTSARHCGQFVRTGIQLGSLENVDMHTTVLGGSHVTARYTHGTVVMEKADAVQLQRGLLEALATQQDDRPDVSGAVADVGRWRVSADPITVIERALNEQLDYLHAEDVRRSDAANIAYRIAEALDDEGWLKVANT